MKKILLGCLIALCTFLLCACGEKSEDEVAIEAVVGEFQQAVNQGDLDKADTYCALNDARRGCWIFRDLNLEIQEDDPSYVVAYKQLALEMFEIDIKDTLVEDDRATYTTCFTMCEPTEFVKGLSQAYTQEQLNAMTVEAAKTEFEDKLDSCVFIMEIEIHLQKANDKWMIVDFR